MSTKRELYKLVTDTYRECDKLQNIRINELKQQDAMDKVIKQQDEFKNKNKFYKGLLKALEKEKENEKN